VKFCELQNVKIMLFKGRAPISLPFKTKIIVGAPYVPFQNQNYDIGKILPIENS
jgi:hypothetical protein